MLHLSYRYEKPTSSAPRLKVHLNFLPPKVTTPALPARSGASQAANADYNQWSWWQLRGSSSPSPWNCRLPSETTSFNSEYSLPFSPLTTDPEKAGDICQTQMAHLENDCASVNKESDRVNREGLDIYVHWKLLISAITTWTHSQLCCRRDQRAAAPLRDLIYHLQRAVFREGEATWLNCSSLHRRGLATL